MAFLFPKLAPDARTPQELAEAIDRLLNFLYAPPIRGVKRELASLPKMYALALTIAERLKAANPKLPPLPAREGNAHVDLRQLRTWGATTSLAPARNVQTAKRRQPWKDNAPGFITASAAARIAAKTEVRKDIEAWVKRIGRRCQPRTCPWHYMRRGRRCKVNFVDFLGWLSNPENPNRQTAQEVLQKTAAAGTLQIQREKWDSLAHDGPQVETREGE